MTLITGISFETDAHLLHYLNRQADADLFRHLLAQTRHQVPELTGWIAKHPLRLLEHATDWPDLLLICRYFRDEYQPDCQYVRQLPLPVHTKFLEERSTLLLSLLAFVTPALLRPDHRDWRKKLGLLVPEPMIRIRVSPDSALTGLLPVAEKQTDFGLPLSAFVRHVQPVRRVFICENLLNFLTLPVLPNTAAIWSGGGFNIECLAGVDWLREKPVLYWGDLDAHGFQILNQCRGYFPNTQAILMDRPTFDAHLPLTQRGRTNVGYFIAKPHHRRDRVVSSAETQHLAHRAGAAQRNVGSGCVGRVVRILGEWGKVNTTQLSAEVVR